MVNDRIDGGRRNRLCRRRDTYSGYRRTEVDSQVFNDVPTGRDWAFERVSLVEMPDLFRALDRRNASAVWRANAILAEGDRLCFIRLASTDIRLDLVDGHFTVRDLWTVLALEYSDL